MTNFPLKATALTAAILAAASVVSGCKAREMGITFSNTQATSVDDSWLLAAYACWPDMAHVGYSKADIKRYLSDPLHFRAAFAAYSPLSDASLIKIVAQPVLDAPVPDTSVLEHSLNPVITRRQALAGGSIRGTLTSDNNSLAPADTLCAIQAGTPVGFK
ncbi:MAG: hypothetical protein PW792_07435 [Acidobacteriaceae bacterium]|nr:hypothetical protein [Acidobacteriaceae bacterium]